MSHYFIENPDILTNERELDLEIFGMHFKFLTNNGLFSCDKIDDASRTMLENIPELHGKLLDLGCGYGVLGVTLAKKYNIDVTISDINSLALDYAKKNAKLNNVNIKAIHSDCFENISGTFDNIVLNPPIHAGKDIMYKMYSQAAQHLTPNGSLYVVILKKHGAESTHKKLNEIYNTKIIYKKKGLFVFCCKGWK